MEFDISPEVCYLNAAAYGPLSRSSLEAGNRALALRATPWKFDKASAAADIDRARSHAAAIIGEIGRAHV